MSVKAELQSASGNEAFHAKANTLRKELEASIPHNLRLPPSLLAKLPQDVTGIPASCGLLTQAQLEITELDATEICAKIAKRELTAVETVTAFGQRAAIAHQLTACLTDYFLDDAIVQATFLDQYLEREGKVIGPLHGLPVSIKNHIRIKGRPAFAGYICMQEISQEDADTVAILRRLGAVFYVKTNQPQSLMHLESFSFYGRVLNPYNIGLTSGGSSGGEGALCALRGSCIGVGSDIGGSIRGPAANCGVYGMRVTAKTLPWTGYWGLVTQVDAVSPSTGPLCRSARDIKLFLDAIYGVQPETLDPSLYPMHWSIPRTLKAKLRVGIMVHDAVVMPHPPTLRGLNFAKKKLEAASTVEVVDYAPYNHDLGYSIIRELYFEDGGKIVRERLAEGGELPLPLTEWVTSPPYTKDHTVQELWELHAKRDEYRRAYSDHWNTSGVDVVLCPPFPGTANPHETAKYWAYTAIWNLLDYPGIVFPTGFSADPSVDIFPSGYQPMSPADAYNLSLYNPLLYVGAPISLQLVARRFNDGALLAAQEIIEGIVKA